MPLFQRSQRFNITQAYSKQSRHQGRPEPLNLGYYKIKPIIATGKEGFSSKESSESNRPSVIEGKKIVWYAEGKLEGKRLQCFYHHPVKMRFPSKWKSGGIMKLHLSDDGNVISGTAPSKSGNIEFKRVQLVSPSVR